MATPMTQAGLPAWANAAWTLLIVLVPAGVWISVLSALDTIVQHARGRAGAPGRAIAVLAAGCTATVVVFAALARVTSAPPPEGQFCYSPTSWTGVPAPVCVTAWPVALLIATLGTCAAAALAAVSVQRFSQKQFFSGVLWFGTSLLIAGAAMGVSRQGFVEPDPLRAGGIVPVMQAAAQAMIDYVVIAIVLMTALASLIWRATLRST